MAIQITKSTYFYLLAYAPGNNVAYIYDSHRDVEGKTWCVGVRGQIGGYYRPAVWCFPGALEPGASYTEWLVTSADFDLSKNANGVRSIAITPAGEVHLLIRAYYSGGYKYYHSYKDDITITGSFSEPYNLMGGQSNGNNDVKDDGQIRSDIDGNICLVFSAFGYNPADATDLTVVYRYRNTNSEWNDNLPTYCQPNTSYSYSYPMLALDYDDGSFVSVFGAYDVTPNYPNYHVYPVMSEGGFGTTLTVTPIFFRNLNLRLWVFNNRQNFFCDPDNLEHVGYNALSTLIGRHMIGTRSGEAVSTGIYNSSNIIAYNALGQIMNITNDTISGSADLRLHQRPDNEIGSSWEDKVLSTKDTYATLALNVVTPIKPYYRFGSWFPAVPSAGWIIINGMPNKPYDADTNDTYFWVWEFDSPSWPTKHEYAIELPVIAPTISNSSGGAGPSRAFGRAINLSPIAPSMATTKVLTQSVWGDRIECGNQPTWGEAACDGVPGWSEETPEGAPTVTEIACDGEPSWSESTPDVSPTWAEA